MQGLERTARIGAAGLLTAGLLAVAGGAAPLAAAAPACTPQTLPGLPGGDGEAEVITIADAGLYGGDARGSDGDFHPVYWTHDGAGWTIHSLPDVVQSGFVADINVHDQMVVTGGNDDGSNNFGFVYDLSSNTATVIHGLGGGDDYDRRINDAGVVAGTSRDTHGFYHAVTWAAPYTKTNVLPDAGASRSFSSPDSKSHAGSRATGINNRGQVAGASFDGGHMQDTDFYARNHIWHDAVAPLEQPLVWQGTGAPSRQPTDNSQGAAWAINDAGLVVGNVVDPNTFNARPTAWVNGRFTDMGAPADIVVGNAYGLSQGGWAAGGYVEPDGTSRAFKWTAADGLVALDPPAGYVNSWSHGVSDALRQIGGNADQGTDGTEVAVVWQC